jgi:hypothetical protein
LIGLFTCFVSTNFLFVVVALIVHEISNFVGCGELSTCCFIEEWARTTASFATGNVEYAPRKVRYDAMVEIDVANRQASLKV